MVSSSNRTIGVPLTENAGKSTERSDEGKASPNADEFSAALETLLSKGESRRKADRDYRLRTAASDGRRAPGGEREDAGVLSGDEAKNATRRQDCGGTSERAGRNVGDLLQARMTKEICRLEFAPPRPERLALAAALVLR